MRGDRGVRERGERGESEGERETEERGRRKDGDRRKCGGEIERNTKEREKERQREKDMIMMMIICNYESRGGGILLITKISLIKTPQVMIIEVIIKIIASNLGRRG